ncbi:dehydrogenase [Novosphingobium sp. SL115]|uniref:GHMP family kinase ATP-binding protein n=1 Tax=Novosphingobium sp. SL115 TaxID=2995150 RepID=UPI002274FDE7|nr:dehydrogenase [Novosphingobium sp. SL115]MCY1670965.1 dehydrogenase [Novosphingobium sp. SL115]
MAIVFDNVRSRAPLRLGLGGGGTDLADYCFHHGGVVLNATIDRYAYAHLTRHREGGIVLKADDLGTEESLPCSLDFDIRQGLCLHRAVYHHMMTEYNGGQAVPMTITTTIDVPAGSGLGASSALTVALIEAHALAMQLPLGPYDVARLAYDIERRHLGLLGGMQDQYAAAFGGFNFIEFLKDEAGVIVNPLRLRRDHLNEFESSLVICFSGQSRESADIIKDQIGGLKIYNDETLAAMHDLKQQAHRMKISILSGDIPGMADVLRESWLAKKRTAASVSNSTVDTLLEVALENGAWAGKVSGAGGGGFIMLLADPERRYGLIRKLNQHGGEASAVKLTFEGAEAWAVR